MERLYESKNRLASSPYFKGQSFCQIFIISVYTLLLINHFHNIALHRMSFNFLDFHLHKHYHNKEAKNVTAQISLPYTPLNIKQNNLVGMLRRRPLLALQRSIYIAIPLNHFCDIKRRRALTTAICNLLIPSRIGLKIEYLVGKSL